MALIRLSKYELWNALSYIPENEDSGRIIKTETIKELEKELNDTMSKSYWVLIDTNKE